MITGRTMFDEVSKFAAKLILMAYSSSPTKIMKSMSARKFLGVVQ